MWVFAVFLAVPLIEIGLFVTVGAWLTLWPTLLIVLGTGILGVSLLRLQGLRAMADVRGAVQTMQSPLSPMANSAMIMAAGVLLILPGFLTDTIGLLLLIPPLRHWLIARLANWLRGFSVSTARPDWRSGPRSGDADMIIDPDYEEIDPDRHGIDGRSRWTQE